MKFINLLLLALTLILSTTASAGLIIDNDSYTTDTNSGLDWLDLSFTTNQSYNDVFSDINNDLGQFKVSDGWRFASGNELNIFLSNVTGVKITGTNRVIHSSGAMNEVVRLLSPTSTQIDTYYENHPELCDDAYCLNRFNIAKGILSDTYLDAHRTAEIFDWNAREDYKNDYSEITAGVIRIEKFNSIGSFLVRTTSVPEPSTLAIFSLALFGLIARKRTLKNQR